jgi:hypothetical protein
MTPITYIGKRERYTEGTYGSKIEWVHGETQLVPEGLAVRLLRHKDVYVEGKDTDKVALMLEKPKVEDTQDLRDSINNLNDPEQLADFAYTNYGQKLDRRKKVETLRSEVISLIDRFGAV